QCTPAMAAGLTDHVWSLAEWFKSPVPSPSHPGGTAMNDPVVTLPLARFEGAARAGCPGCGSPLELHQPDPERPGRLLGPCSGCGTWSLLDVVSGWSLGLPGSVSPDRADSSG